MKKTLLFLFVVLGVNFSTFANEPVSIHSEGWLRIGFEFGNFFEWEVSDGIVERSYTGSPGINYSSYSFFNKSNVGLFSSGFFGFPVLNSATNNFSNFDFTFQVGLILGVGFRRELSERFTFHSGIGLNFMNSFFAFTEYFPDFDKSAECTLITYTFGIGGDVGFKFTINNTMFLSFGSIFTYDFARYAIGEASIDSVGVNFSKWDALYRGVGIRPYITLGFAIRQIITRL